jgi:exodeoxyribonuclease VII large subunit
MNSATNTLEYSVSEIASALKRMVEDNFGHVRIRGEISGAKLHGSGHFYLSLKDDSSVISAVCWKGVYGKLKFKPEDGLEVICTGRITTYPGRSQYQLVIEQMEPAGVGALMAMLEKLKAKLAAEGLFAAERKKPLPFIPETIGVITSPTGAVIQDILHRLGDRFPCRVLLWPVAVQGEGAVEQICNAIKGFNSIARADDASVIPRPDILILARGGGSVEDLWCFNDEMVVRAVAESAIPIITAVGHETDTTLVDFASDLRAPTPTGAAEMAVPVRLELMALMSDYQLRLQNSSNKLLATHYSLLTAMARALPNPERLLENASQKLDDWSERLKNALPGLLEVRRNQLQVISAKLHPRQFELSINRDSEKLDFLKTRHNGNLHNYIEKQSAKLATLSSLLESYNYRKTLERGFALVTCADSPHKLVKSTHEATAAKGLNIEFADGKVQAQVGIAGVSSGEPGGISPAVPKVGTTNKKRVKAHAVSENQGSLF